MSLYEEFKKFAMRGNAIDLAIGVVIGVAFGGIVTSLVKDIINPPLGLLLGGIDFSNFYVVLKGAGPYPSLKAAQDAGAVVLTYGLFINAVIMVQTHKIHHTIAATRQTEARKFLASLS